jgi:hypothetical protein
VSSQYSLQFYVAEGLK